MSNFREMTPQWLQKKFKLLKYEQFQLMEGEARHRFDHAKKYSEEFVISGLYILTESDRILKRGLFKRGRG